jgi:hypothetical protein
MKHLCAFFLVFLSVQTFFAQKNTFALDVRYLPACGEIIAGGSINYYRAVGERRSLGLKTTWNSDALGVASDETRTHVVNLDAVNRWKISKKEKVRWFGEAGISGLGVVERTPPQDYLLYCGVGMTDEQIAELADYHSQWHTETQIMVGFATATSLEFSLSNQFSLGAALAANVYYSPADDCICPYLIPSLRTAFSF